MRTKISRRFFFATGLGLLVPVLGFPHHLFTKDQLKLNQEFINQTKRRIEREILQAMEKIYLHERETFDDNYNSGNNAEWETVESLRELVKEYVDPNFEV